MRVRRSSTPRVEVSDPMRLLCSLSLRAPPVNGVFFCPAFHCVLGVGC